MPLWRNRQTQRSQKPWLRRASSTLAGGTIAEARCFRYVPRRPVRRELGGLYRRIKIFEVVIMAARLTDKQKKKIVADYLETESYNATAKMNGVCGQTVRRVVDESQGITENLKRKKDENTADILAYMESKRGVVCEIIDKGLAALNSEDKLAEASPAQITTALGTLIDKWAAVSGGSRQESNEDGLSRSLRELAEELESDDIV